MENVTDFVNVAVRIRPPFNEEDTTISNLRVVPYNPPTLFVSERHFTFDHIFDGDTDQATVFNDVIRPMINKFLLGYNCTVFAYGQTGTGKTYTMGDAHYVNVENIGIINRTFKEIFENLNPGMEIYTEVSLYEIYNEKVFDLLDDNKVPLAVKGFAVPGLKKVPVDDLISAEELFVRASKNRTTAGTSQNTKSSRSHAVYTLYCTISNGESVKKSKFNFVDLAGSESVRKTGSEGSTFHEGVNINKGLLCLGQVINALCSNQNHIPYRQAIITTILRDSLSRKNYITLIACVSSKSMDTTETLQTLDFARRVKKIISKPESYFFTHNSFKKPAVNLPAPGFTPMKPLRSVQTSTVLKAPRYEPMMATYIPSETVKHQMRMSKIQEPTIRLSPIVRMCVEQIEAKLSTTVSMLVNEKARSLLRRSSRISGIWQRCDGIVVDENDESAVFKHKNRADHSESRVLEDIIKQNRISRENASIADIHKDCENPTEEKRNNKTVLFKALSDRSINIVKRKSQRLQLKQTSSPNLTIDYGEFAKELRQEQQPPSRRSNQVIDGPISPMMPAPVLRRSVRLSMKLPTKSVHEFGGSNNIQCDTGPKLSKRRIKEELSAKVPAKKFKGSKIEEHYNRVLETLNVGTIKSLASLHTIGPKTAEHILLYRELRGKFKAIEDIKTVLIKGTAYKRFMEANFLE